MLFKKKPKANIDLEQLALIQYAQQRIKQKKRLYYHIVLFLIIALALFTFNVILGFADEYKIAGFNWSTLCIIFWLLFVIWHAIKVFIINTFMGKNWEQQQLKTLVAKQQNRIEKLKKQVLIEEEHKAKSNAYNHTLNTKQQELTIIVAAGENDAIGKDNKLIWHLSNDLKRFKKLTSGHHIIMGRKTFESFPKPLPNRTHIVITRQNNYQAPESVIVVNSLQDAIKAAKEDKQPFIIGGGQIYQQAMMYAQKIELTRVHHAFPNADTFFPKIDTTIWKETDNTLHKKDDKHPYEFSFITYVKK